MGLSVGVAGVGRRVEDAEGTQWRRWGGESGFMVQFVFLLPFFLLFKIPYARQTVPCYNVSKHNTVRNMRRRCY